MLALFLVCVHSSENDQRKKEYFFFLKEIVYTRGLIFCFYKELSVLLFIPDPSTFLRALNGHLKIKALNYQHI